MGGAGPSVLYTHRQAGRRLFGQVWSLRGLWSSAPFWPPPSFSLLPPHLLEILSRLAVSAFFPCSPS